MWLFFEVDQLSAAVRHMRIEDKVGVDDLSVIVDIPNNGAFKQHDQTYCQPTCLIQAFDDVVYVPFGCF